VRKGGRGAELLAVQESMRRPRGGAAEAVDSAIVPNFHSAD
jgi:hypothetical protein